MKHIKQYRYDMKQVNTVFGRGKIRGRQKAYIIRLGKVDFPNSPQSLCQRVIMTSMPLPDNNSPI